MNCRVLMLNVGRQLSPNQFPPPRPDRAAIAEDVSLLLPCANARAAFHKCDGYACAPSHTSLSSCRQFPCTDIPWTTDQVPALRAATMSPPRATPTPVVEMIARFFVR